MIEGAENLLLWRFARKKSSLRGDWECGKPPSVVIHPKKIITAWLLGVRTNLFRTYFLKKCSKSHQKSAFFPKIHRKLDFYKFKLPPLEMFVGAPPSPKFLTDNFLRFLYSQKVRRNPKKDARQMRRDLKIRK